MALRRLVLANNRIFVRAIRAVAITVACPAARYTTTIVASKLLFRTSLSVRAVFFIGAVRAIAVTVTPVCPLHTQTIAANKLFFGTRLRNSAVIFIRAIVAVAISVTAPLLWDALVGRDALELIHRTRSAGSECPEQCVRRGRGDTCGENHRCTEQLHECRRARTAHVSQKIGAGRSMSCFAVFALPFEKSLGLSYNPH